MKPPSFKYFAPHHLEEALELQREYGADATLLAGGQSLVPSMNFRLAQPAVLIDLNRIKELFYVKETKEKGLEVGSMTRQATLEEDPRIPRLCPLLAETVPHIAHPQIRNRGTLGGSLAHNDPAAELPAVALVLDCRIQLRSTRGSRWLPASDFFAGMFTTAREEDEILTAVEIPPRKSRTGYAFNELARRHGDYALVGVAAALTLDPEGLITGARIAFLNAGDGAVQARKAEEFLEQGPASTERLQEAARLAAAEDIDPLEDIHASVRYRRHLAEVLTRQTLASCALRVASGE